VADGQAGESQGVGRHGTSLLVSAPSAVVQDVAVPT
jgi:hypothetical protein